MNQDPDIETFANWLQENINSQKRFQLIVTAANSVIADFELKEQGDAMVRIRVPYRAGQRLWNVWPVNSKGRLIGFKTPRSIKSILDKAGL